MEALPHLYLYLYIGLQSERPAAASASYQAGENPPDAHSSGLPTSIGMHFLSGRSKSLLRLKGRMFTTANCSSASCSCSLAYWLANSPLPSLQPAAVHARRGHKGQGLGKQ